MRIGEGMTNRQIGESLSLAEKTVKNYVTSELTKLQMERPTRAAVFAAENGIQRSRRGRPAVFSGSVQHKDL